MNKFLIRKGETVIVYKKLDKDYDKSEDNMSKIEEVNKIMGFSENFHMCDVSEICNMKNERYNVEKTTESILADIISYCHNNTEMVALVDVIFAISTPGKSQTGGYYEKSEKNILTALIALLNLHGEELGLTYSVDTLISLTDDMRNRGVKNSKIEEYYKNLIKHNECDVFVQCYSEFINQTSEKMISPILISCIIRLQSVDEWFTYKAKEISRVNIT